MTEADESMTSRPTAEAGAVEPVAMKPCPWCGGGVGPVVEEGARFRWRRVTGCCADGPEVRHDTMADDQAAAEVDSRAAAIAAWNNRPAEDTLRAQLEAAERLVAAVEVQAEENFQKYVDANEARIDAEARAEAAEAEWREKFEARTIDWSEASNALYVWRHRAKDAEARAEAAEAECQRLSDGLTTIASYKLRDFAGPHGMAINCVHVARETLAARTKEAAP